MGERRMLDRKRSFGEIYDSAPNPAKYEQDGLLFNGSGEEIGTIKAGPYLQEPTPQRPAGEPPSLPEDPWKAWKIPHLRVEYQRVMGAPADKELGRDALIQAIEAKYEAP